MKIKWTEKESLWMIKRYYIFHYEKLIKYGHELKDKEWQEEWRLFQKEFKNERSLNSIRMFIGNLNFLAIEEIEKHNNPYNINLNLKNFYSNYAKQTKRIWEEQKQYFPEVNKLFQIS